MMTLLGFSVGFSMAWLAGRVYERAKIEQEHAAARKEWIEQHTHRLKVWKTQDEDRNNRLRQL